MFWIRSRDPDIRGGNHGHFQLVSINDELKQSKLFINYFYIKKNVFFLLIVTCNDNVNIVCIYV